MGHSKGIPEWEVYSDTGLLKKNRNISNKQSNPHLQEHKEQQQRETRANTRKEITKIRSELNNIDMKTSIVRINESRSWFFEKIKKMYMPLSRLIKKKRERIQTNTIRN